MAKLFPPLLLSLIASVVAGSPPRKFVTVIWGDLVSCLRPCLLILGLLTLLDFLSGIIAAYVSRTISEDVAYRGAVRKALPFLLVMAVALIEFSTLGTLQDRFGHEVTLPLNPTVLVTTFFAWGELVSMIRNAVEAGLPLPTFLRRLIGRLDRRRAPRRG